MSEEIIKSYQDYQLIEANVDKCIEEYGSKYNFKERSIGFLFFTLERIFNLQEDECEEAITDTSYITRQDAYKNGIDHPHDKGIDAIIIDEEKKIIHLMNFKYYLSGFDKIKNKRFESGEIPKVKSILKDIFERKIPSNANPVLVEKLKEIFLLQDRGTRFEFKIHFIANIYNPFTNDEEIEFRDTLVSDYKNDVKFEYILIQDFISKLIEKSENINAKFKINGKNFFEKSEYGYRALICEINATDLIRIVLSNETVRMNIEASEEEMRVSTINENAFEDNVRIYLKQRSNINKNIKNTALNEYNEPLKLNQ